MRVCVCALDMPRHVYHIYFQRLHLIGLRVQSRHHYSMGATLTTHIREFYCKIGRRKKYNSHAPRKNCLHTKKQRRKTMYKYTHTRTHTCNSAREHIELRKYLVDVVLFGEKYGYNKIITKFYRLIGKLTSMPI
jgi:hypothetical protein